MRIVTGRGNRRQVVVVPTGSIVRNASPDEQRIFLRNVCRIIGIA